MKMLYKSMKYAVAIIGAAVISVGCDEFLTTNPSTEVSDTNVQSYVGQLDMALTSAYKHFLFGSHTNQNGDRVYAGIPGFQMYYDLRGTDIMCGNNMGGSQCSSTQFDPAVTRTDGQYAQVFWEWGYKLINLLNKIIDSSETAVGSDSDKAILVGQAKAMRGVAYFHLILNYQNTYALAKNKRGVILRLHKDDPQDMGFSTAEEVYQQILKDLNEANTALAGYSVDGQPWRITTDVINGYLARVYQCMNDWNNAYKHANAVYSKYPNLMTEAQWTGGFDDQEGVEEVFWYITYDSNNNLGGGTQYNFWFNYDPGYGETANDVHALTGKASIYKFMNFFATPEYVALFDEGDYRGGKKLSREEAVAKYNKDGQWDWEAYDAAVQGVNFWQRALNTTEYQGYKWAYNKWKHYGNEAGQTLPTIPLMRSSEMLLIMAEAAANGAAGDAKSLLNKLQTARGAQATDASLENIYKERRKELLGEGVTGQYDLLRLQKGITRKLESENAKEEYILSNVQHFPGFSSSATTVSIPANDYRFICQIPIVEFNENKAISTSDNNPYEGK